ncbi:MAG: hypothetical protein GY832_31155 [Chloroflexi bacterium]|nr:hypothetical protein [Chloroflexota bacterium]
MGPGHFAIGLVAKPAAPKVPLWVLLMATEIFDFLFFAFQAAGLESMAVTTMDWNQGMQIQVPGSAPYSHGLLACVIWSVVAAVIVYVFYRDRRTSIIMGLVVFSHWVLDFIVHLPDLPLLFEGSPLVGLGLWGSGPGLIVSILLELGLLFGGIAFYLVMRKRGAIDK